jgi:thiol-disulfide isomerase/thioredoxin
MLDAQRMLGPAGARLQLLGVDANPDSVSIHDVLSYSELHGMTRAWHFLTGSLPRLRAVWRRYGIGVEVARGQIDHTPALFLIDRSGRLRRIYLTQQSYAAVGQLGRVLAEAVARLLPGHPRVDSTLSYARIPPVGPGTAIRLPLAGGGHVRLGPLTGSGHARLGPVTGAHLYVFFATWDREVTPIGRDLLALNGYAREAARRGLPAVTAVDEGSVEPSPGALNALLRGLPKPLAYPIAVDTGGRVADGYGVQDEPWFALVGRGGRIAWWWDAGTSGWPSSARLLLEVRAALARAAAVPGSAAAVRRALAGSPAPLAALHRRAGRLAGAGRNLAAEVRALHGYPIVVNAWASSCGPCQAEFGLLASASVRFGRRVAFLGADTNDQPADARAFLARHPVSYPSYSTTAAGLQAFLPGGVEGLPTTFFISPSGQVVFVHTGQYVSQGTLDQDIRAHALGGSS